MNEDNPGGPGTEQIILQALKEAAEAHGVHEATMLGGVHDVNWPDWYAKHMARTLEKLGFSLEKIAD
jgi:2-iminoacetate synthase ThiH